MRAFQLLCVSLVVVASVSGAGNAASEAFCASAATADPTAAITAECTKHTVGETSLLTFASCEAAQVDGDVDGVLAEVSALCSAPDDDNCAKNGGTRTADCAAGCVKNGGTWVPSSPSGDTGDCRTTPAADCAKTGGIWVPSSFKPYTAADCAKNSGTWIVAPNPDGGVCTGDKAGKAFVLVHVRHPHNVYHHTNPDYGVCLDESRR